jgi:hypothetical protein
VIFFEHSVLRLSAASKLPLLRVRCQGLQSLILQRLERFLVFFARDAIQRIYAQLAPSLFLCLTLKFLDALNAVISTELAAASRYLSLTAFVLFTDHTLFVCTSSSHLSVFFLSASAGDA